MIWLELMTTVLLPSFAFGAGIAGFCHSRGWRERYWIARDEWRRAEHDANREALRAAALEEALATPCPRCGASRDVEVYR